jgi:hypothetical protein
VVDGPPGGQLGQLFSPERYGGRYLDAYGGSPSAGSTIDTWYGNCGWNQSFDYFKGWPPTAIPDLRVHCASITRARNQTGKDWGQRTVASAKCRNGRNFKVGSGISGLEK